MIRLVFFLSFKADTLVLSCWLVKDLERISENRTLLYDQKISTFLQDGQKSFNMLKVIDCIAADLQLDEIV